MSTEMARVLAALAIGGIVSGQVYINTRQGTRQYGVFYSRGGGVLPGVVVMVLLVSLLFGVGGSWGNALEMFSWIVEIFVLISVYFVLLTLALPLLRRYFRAEACALLWIIPNYLYITIHIRGWDWPRWVIPLPAKWLAAMGVVWLAGMIGVLSWKIGSHLWFRRWLLQGAEEVSDPAVLAVWQEELTRAGEKEPEFTLVTSPQATTPMTIGLLTWSVRVVLPRRNYTPEELRLIFRHELVHLGREDAWSKFFLAFCTAVCWFNPLMWLAMNKSAQDLELSCDEMVASSLNEGERRQYADLILRTAGDSRGFTTCLSASASALRYRLKGIVQPTRRHTGAVLVGVAAGLLMLAFGQVGVACGVGTGAESLFGGKPGNVSLTEAAWTGERPYVPVSCRDEGALTDYLASLTLYQMAEDYLYPGDGVERISLTYETPLGKLEADLYGDGIRVMTFWEESSREYYYYVSGGLDWERLEGLFDW